MSNMLIWEIGMKLEIGSQNPKFRKNKSVQSTASERYFLRYRGFRELGGLNKDRFPKLGFKTSYTLFRTDVTLMGRKE